MNPASCANTNGVAPGLVNTLLGSNNNPAGLVAPAPCKLIADNMNCALLATDTVTLLPNAAMNPGLPLVPFPGALGSVQTCTVPTPSWYI